jgi:Tfp pilus assembly protein PilO
MVLKRREKIMVGVAVLVGVVMGFDQFVAYPKKKEVKELQKQMEEYNQKLGTVTASLGSLKIIKKRVEEKRKEKAEAANKVPDERQLGILLEHIGKEGQKQQISLSQLTINDETSGAQGEKKEAPKSKPVKKVILEVGLLSGYDAIGPFLNSIQNLPIFSDFERIEVNRKDELLPKLQITFAEDLYMTGQGAKKEGEKVSGR